MNLSARIVRRYFNGGNAFDGTFCGDFEKFESAIKDVVIRNRKKTDAFFFGKIQNLPWGTRSVGIVRMNVKIGKRKIFFQISLPFSGKCL